MEKGMEFHTPPKNTPVIVTAVTLKIIEYKLS